MLSKYEVDSLLEECTKFFESHGFTLNVYTVHTKEVRDKDTDEILCVIYSLSINNFQDKFLLFGTDSVEPIAIFERYTNDSALYAAQSHFYNKIVPFHQEGLPSYENALRYLSETYNNKWIHLVDLMPELVFHLHDFLQSLGYKIIYSKEEVEL